MQDRSLARAVVVITGASSGNGRATARAFAGQGASLVLAARRAPALNEAAAECEQLGGRAIAARTDVSDPDAVEELGRKAIAAFGRIDIWINNAGVLHIGRLDETPARILHRVIETDLFGCIHGSQVAIRHFRQRGRGTLINMCSVLGVVGQPYAGAYVASKFGIRGLSESLRQELLDQPDIHVCAILPAAIDTPIYQRAANHIGRPLSPIRPLYDPDVVAETMLSLARHPRREAFAGKFGVLAAGSKTIAPALTERVVRMIVDRMEIGQEPVPASDGNLFEPSDDRWKVRGGWREQLGRSRMDGRTLAGLALAAASLGLALSWTRSSRPAATGAAANPRR
jgi:NAD(P)-dependent dehydrogenase (short-subunit alcohol dehydrogenase family)